MFLGLYFINSNKLKNVPANSRDTVLRMGNDPGKGGCVSLSLCESSRLGIQDHVGQLFTGCLTKGVTVLSNKRLLGEAFAFSIVFHFSVLRPSLR